MDRMFPWTPGGAGRTTHVAMVFLITICVLAAGLPQVPGKVGSHMNEEAMDPGSRSGNDAGGWVEEISTEDHVEIPAGHQFYLGLDPKNLTFHPLEMPPADAGFTDLARRAVETSPEWLRGNLTRNLALVSDVDIRTGPYSSPALGDIDGDGDQDLAVGDEEGVRFYWNEGTSDWPVFAHAPGLELDGDGFGPVDEGGLGRWAPAMGDLDGDGLVDLVLGNGEGSVIYYLGEEDGARFLGPFSIPAVDESGNSHPDLGDLDDDGDLDLITGNSRGTVRYYENTGTAQDHEFTLRPMRTQGMDVGRNSTPAFGDLDDDGDLDLTVGSASSDLTYYSNLAGAFVLDLSEYAGLQVGEGTSPMLADLHPDRMLDLYVGLAGGRIVSFRNRGTSEDPTWRSWSSFDLFEGVAYHPRYDHMRVRSKGIMNRLAGTILDAEDRLQDEIGFTVANTAPEVLRALNDTQVRVLVDNADLIYEIEPYLPYADLVEWDDYTTVSYTTLYGGTPVQRELSRDMYYWYIVHPQITDEVTHYIDPDTGRPADPGSGGEFWRDYLFHHADASYPNASGYPEDTSPPLLKDLVSTVDHLWNGTPWHAPGGRPVDYGENALIRVANWVGKTLILNEQEAGDGERPIQPVRIAHHHNGNCGELQDLTIAASRTVLIPAKAVSMPGEDHVWIEFYEGGWHQWDNYWSDGGSVIDNYMNYWEGWGERGGGGIFAWRGDESIWEVTRKYIDPEDVSRITFVVEDREGNPVDGARIVAASHWLLQSDTDPVEVTIPFPSIFNYTDYEGVATLYLAAQDDVRDANKNFTFKVVSRVGQAETGKVSIEQGEDYTYEFTLEGTVPGADRSVEMVSGNRTDLRLRIEAEPGVGVHRPLNPVDERTQRITVPPSDSIISGERPLGLVLDQKNLELFLDGRDFEAMGAIDENGTADIFIPTEGLSYLVFPTDGLVETSKTVAYSAAVEVFQREPRVGISEPGEGETFVKGSLVNISGEAFDPFGIDSLMLSTDGGVGYTNITGNLENNTWEYKFYTMGEETGSRTIIVSAENRRGLVATASVNITIEDVDLNKPSISITRPQDGEEFREGDMIPIDGRANDDEGVDLLELSLNDGGTWMEITDRLVAGSWSYDWDTRGRPPGSYNIVARASDVAGNVASDSVLIHLEGERVDETPPSVHILEPGDGEEMELGDDVVFRGTATDDVGVTSLEIKIGDILFEDIEGDLFQGEWSYSWETVGVDPGRYVVLVRASDGATNIAEDTIGIMLTEGEGQGDDGEPGPGPGDGDLIDSEDPDLELFEPVAGQEVRKGDLLMVYGRVRDDSGEVELEILVDGEPEDITERIQSTYFTYMIDTRDHLEGALSIVVRAQDPAGNEAEMDVGVRIVDMDHGGEGGPFEILEDPPAICIGTALIATMAVAVVLVASRGRGGASTEVEPVRKGKRKKKRKIKRRSKEK